MADIFVSYAREDRPHAQRLAADLQKHGWTVWWDRHIHAGKHYDEVIQRELELVRAVIVLWSQHSVPSRWVKTEAREGLIRDILVPLQVDQSPVPLEFRQVQSIAFDGPTLEAGTPAFDDLIEALSELVGAPQSRSAQAAPLVAASTPESIAPPVVSAPAAAAPAPATFERELSFEIPGDATPRFPMRMRAIAASAAALVILIAGGWLLSAQRREGPASQPEQQAAAVAAPAVPPPPSQPEPPPPAAPVAVPSTDAAAEVAPPALHDFVAAFLKVWGSGDIEQLLPLYASKVDYFDKGIVDQSFIRQDRQTYQQRWPQIQLQLDGDVVGRQESDGFRLTFKTRYETVSSARNEKAQGTTEVSLLVAGSSPESFRIAGHKEGTKPTPF